MKLTNYEQDVLNGKYGEGAAMAMEIQVAIGETFDAPRMVPGDQNPCGAQRTGRRPVVCRKAAFKRGKVQDSTDNQSEHLHQISE